jgi:hypothetical protein
MDSGEGGGGHSLFQAVSSATRADGDKWAGDGAPALPVSLENITHWGHGCEEIPGHPRGDDAPAEAAINLEVGVGGEKERIGQACPA